MKENSWIFFSRKQLTVGGLVTIFSPDLPSLQGGGSSDSPLKIFQSYIIIVIVTIITLYTTSAKILCRVNQRSSDLIIPGLAPRSGFF